MDHLFQPFFIIVWCMDCLFCRFPGPKPVVPSLAQEPIAFHCHRVPDSFQLPHCDGFVEVRHRGPLDLVRAPLVFVRYRACFLLEGERYWEIFLGFARSCTKPPSWDARRAYLSFFPYFCRYRFVLAVLHVEDGSYWSTMVL